MSYAATRAIALRCTDYSETSQVVAAVTPDLGQVHLLAKGSRRPRKSPKNGVWDMLNEYDLVLRIRASGGLHLATEWAVRGYPVGVRRTYERFVRGSYAAEVVLALTSETSDDGPVFHALADYLAGLAGDRAGLEHRVRFLRRALTATGHAPLMDACAACGGSLQGVTRFSARFGGVLCGTCAGADPAAPSLSRGALAVLRAFDTRGPSGTRLRVTPAQAREIQRAFDEQIQYHLGRPLRTRRFLRDLME